MNWESGQKLLPEISKPPKTRHVTETEQTAFPESLASDWTNYVNRRVPIDEGLYDLFFALLVLQIVVCGNFVASGQYWEQNIWMARFIYGSGCVSLMSVPDINTTSYLVVASLLLFLTFLDVVVTGVSLLIFMKDRHVPYGLCWLSRTLGVVLNTFLFPFCLGIGGRFMLAVFGDPSARRNVALSFTVFLTLIYITVRVSLYFTFTHYVLDFNEPLFRISKPTAIIRLYLSIGFVTFVGHALPPTNDRSHFAVYTFVIGVIFMYNWWLEWTRQFWFLETQSFIIKLSISFVCVSSLVVCCDVTFGLDNDPQDLFWTVLFLVGGIYFLSEEVLRAAVRRTLKSLDDGTFTAELPNKNRAFRLYILALRYGHKSALDGTLIEHILKEHPHDFDFLFLFARISLAVGTCPVDLQTLARRINPGSTFNPIRECALINLMRVMSPEDQMQREHYQNRYGSLNSSFRKLIESIRSIYSTILDEFTTNLPKTTVSFQVCYRKAIKRLFQFVQLYSASPDAQFFVDLLEQIYPEAEELPELRLWVGCHKDFVACDLTMFPSHLQLAIEEPRIFRCHKPVFVCDEHVLPSQAIESSGSRYSKDVVGPYQHIIHKWYIHVIAIACLVFPLIIMNVESHHFVTLRDRTRYLDNGYRLISHMEFQKASLFTLLLNFDTPEFSNDKETYQQYLDGLLNRVIDFQQDVTKYFTGSTKSYKGALELTMPTYELFAQNYTHGDVPISSFYQAMTSVAFLASDLLIDDNLYIVSETTGKEESIRILEFHTNELTKELYEYVKSIPQLPQRILNWPVLGFGVTFVVLLIIVLVTYIAAFRNALPRSELFFMTLRETSKAAVAKVLADYKKCSQCIVSSKSRRRKKGLRKSVWTVLSMAPFTFGLAFLFMLSSVVGFQTVLYYSRAQMQTSLNTIEEFCELASNLSFLYVAHQKTRSSDFGEKTDLLNMIDAFVVQVQDGAWKEPIRSIIPSFSMRDLIVKNDIANETSYERLFYEWVGSVYMSAHLDTTGDIRRAFWANVTRDFHLTIVPEVGMLEDQMREAILKCHDYSEKILFGFMISYGVLVIVILALSLLAIYIADRPFRSIVKILSKLPENALSKDTVRILGEHSWDFAITQFDFDPMYYGSVLKIIPDAVIVVDITMTILSYNNAAKRLLIEPDDDDGKSGTDPLVHRKLFEALAMDLKESEEPVATGEDMDDQDAVGFCDIFEEYLFDDRTEIVNHRLSGTRDQQRFWYQLTILPIMDETVDHMVAKTRNTNHFALIFRDIGDEIRQQMMLEQETEKHFAIVNQILPPAIAKRLLDGERSISMTVDNVAISFCDIVQFTPWCGSQTPDTVVAALNHMFKMFDEICSGYDSVTKIKCIGDCYMSAAGIFDDGADPEMSAKEMVRCALDLIDAIIVVNKDLNTELAVRIGIAFGGPISAGVMGIHKPVFDIWGEIVNDANQMESTGLPMKVHITSELYEIVKTEPFVFTPGSNNTWFVTRT